jgi:peptidoglycan/LPS O-acetylase OafA/YrhL
VILVDASLSDHRSGLVARFCCGPIDQVPSEPTAQSTVKLSNGQVGRSTLQIVLMRVCTVLRPGLGAGVSMKRIGYLDGLRGLAALQVVVQHYTMAFAPGWVLPLGFPVNGNVAVLLFFLISGLVLTRSFERAPNAIFAGLARRLIRLGLPLTIAVLFAFALEAVLPGWSQEAARKSGSGWLAAVYIPADAVRAFADAGALTMLTGHNNTTLFSILSHVAPRLATSPNAPIWSLHVEFWGSALILALVWTKSRSIRLYIPAVCLAAVLTGGNALFLFVYGQISALVVRTTFLERLTSGLWTSLAAFVLLATGIFVCNGEDLPGLVHLGKIVARVNIVERYEWFSWSLMVGSVMIFTAILLLPVAHKALSMGLPRLLGRLSFSIYLLHWPAC